MRILSDHDRWLFSGGTADQAYDFMGCHLDEDGAQAPGHAAAIHGGIARNAPQ